MLALVSDIHSNLEAFEAVLIEIEKLRVSKIYCLGDVIGYGPNPVECLELALEFDLCLVGNHEEALVRGPYLFNRMAEKAITWTKETIDASPRAPAYWQWIENLPYYHQEGDVLFTHGSPRDCATEYINLRDVEDDAGKIEDIFTYFSRVCFVGHTHVPCVITDCGKTIHPRQRDLVDLSQFGKSIVNVGSVGQPRDGDNRACFATFDGKELCWHRLPYKFEKTMAKIFKAKALAKTLGQRLEVGR